MVDVRPSNILIASSIFFMLVLASTSIINNFIEKKPSMVGTDYDNYYNLNSTFNKYSQMQSAVSDLKANINASSSSDWKDFGVLNSLIGGAWQAIKGMFSTFGFVTDMFTNLDSIIPGIPSWVGYTIAGILSIIIIVAIWGAIFQRDW